MYMRKYALSPETVFDFTFLTYTQMIETHKVDTGCGSLVYTPYFIVAGAEDILYAYESEYEQKESFRFRFDAFSSDLIGHYTFSIHVESNIVINEP